MNTATIKFHACNNNGSFFQAYVLQTLLIKQLGTDNEIIDFRSDKMLRLYKLFRPVRSPRDLAKNMVSLRHYGRLKKRNDRFEMMRRTHLRMTERCSTEEEVYQLAKKYDLLIAGSDQIWNTTAPDFSAAYFLPDVKNRKITYAISCGSDSGESEIGQYAEAIREFSSVAVRDASTARHMKQQTGIDAMVTIDPTLLADADFYNAMVTDTPIIREEYIFFYSIMYQPEVVKRAKRIAEQLGMRIITVFTSFRAIVAEKNGIEIQYSAGPAEFLNLIRNASYVLTNSFHGTAFSIIYEKPFLHICETENGVLKRDDRIDNLIDELEIGQCNTGTDDSPAVFPKVDWDVVMKKRSLMKENALEYLKKAISGGVR